MKVKFIQTSTRTFLHNRMYISLLSLLDIDNSMRFSGENEEDDSAKTNKNCDYQETTALETPGTFN